MTLMRSPTALTRVLIIVAVLAVIAGGYFASQTVALSRAREALEEEKARLTSELTVLKVTDQVLRAELLQEKLTTAERDLAAARQEVDQLRNRSATLEDNARKLRPHFRAVQAVQQGVYGGGPLERNLPVIREAIAALGHPGLLEQWQKAERTVRDDLADGSWSPQPISDILTLLLRRVEQLLSTL